MFTNALSLMILVPVLGAVGLMFSEPKRVARWVALGTASISGVLGLVSVTLMNRATSDLQWVERYEWMGLFNIEYFLGLDGLNALPILLVSVIVPILIASEWSQKKSPRGLMGLLLLLQASLLGALLSQDLFLMFFFWSMTVIPLYFMVGIWTDGKKLEQGSLKLVIHSGIGNALLFSAIILVYYGVDPHSFAIPDVSGGVFKEKTLQLFGHTIGLSGIAFLLFSVGFGLRLAVWPLHGWLSDVISGAPASLRVVISSLSVPVGLSLWIRVGYSLFPDALTASAKGIAILGVLNLLFASFSLARAKKVSELFSLSILLANGLMLIGLGSLTQSGLVGANFQIFAAAIALAVFALAFGILLRQIKDETKLGDDWSGIAFQTPALTTVIALALVASLGFPGLAGFIGQSLLVLGSFPVLNTAVVLVGLSLVFAAIGYFSVFKDGFFGAEKNGGALVDLTKLETAYLLPLVLALVVFGLFPKPLLDTIRPTLITLLSTLTP